MADVQAFSLQQRANTSDDRQFWQKRSKTYGRMEHRYKKHTIPFDQSELMISDFTSSTNECPIQPSLQSYYEHAHIREQPNHTVSFIKESVALCQLVSNNLLLEEAVLVVLARSSCQVLNRLRPPSLWRFLPPRSIVAIPVRMQCILLLSSHFDLFHRVLEDLVEAICLIRLVPVHGDDDDEMVFVQLGISINSHTVRVVLLLWRKLLVGQAGSDILRIGDFEAGGVPDVIDLFADSSCDLDRCCYIQGTEQTLVHVLIERAPQVARSYC